MASFSMAQTIITAPHKNLNQNPTSQSFFKPMPADPSKVEVSSMPKTRAGFKLKAAQQDEALAGLTKAAALTTYVMVPAEIAEATGPELTPSLKNFLLSILAGGVVLAVLLGAVIAVANFDPVKRNR